ncbi:GntR family transcriptional regulator [Paramaledivibacter caminithermalis]|jgi:DNA-binding GntR family transcriptional regulator|uniref:DNA-binding transcriptional regulator, GntR family n=1 Tax=Paramaledivibacter caminithermalis (strain DSM 15212 / CIP 107654 / DViRD3) TaxID=1121301 RepID=A0A1M6K1I5_PARC5|nr:GntR family transcriptional regulator [Paramaledivibacter caminithermalis]SHJ52774.1 DNA-binding transcriptional regulator, GntR family [Paramaledivibacter caminithermalis DSM 15212]
MNQYMSLKDHVYNYISQKINEGSLTPNEKINEQLICEELNISRTPVREALIQLATEGYLENIPRKGFRVRPIDENKAIEFYMIIGVLEGLAAYNAVDYITSKEISYMKELLISMDKAIDIELYDDYYKIQTVFHNTFVNICNNEELIRLINQLKRSFIRQTYINKESDNLYEILKVTNSEHKEIIKLFELKDKEKLRSYIRDVHWNTQNAKFDSI